LVLGLKGRDSGLSTAHCIISQFPPPGKSQLRQIADLDDLAFEHRLTKL
jgi:hypothetical protein